MKLLIGIPFVLTILALLLFFILSRNQKVKSIYVSVIEGNEIMIFARKTYFQAKGTGDEELAIEAKELYESAVTILNDPRLRKMVVKYLPEDPKNECLKIIDGPRYGLY